VAQPTENAEGAVGSPVKRFFTSLPGVMTGLAAVVTAGATIVGILFPHQSSDDRASPVATPSAPGSSTAATPSATASTPRAVQVGFRRLWGPAPLVVSNDGTDLTGIPPRNTGGLDLYDDGSGFGPMSGTRLAVWTGSTAPTPEQCLDVVQSQSSGADVQTPVGTTVCALTSAGELAIIRVLSLDTGSAFARTETSIWAKT